MVRKTAPIGAAWVCVDSPHGMRALTGTALAATVRSVCKEYGMTDVPVEVADSFAEGIERAKELAGPAGVVCAWGSLYSLAELKAALGV